MSEKRSISEPGFAALVAIDWADKKHVWALQPSDSDAREQGEIKHTPEAIDSWVAMLSSRFSGQPIAVAVEQSRGALVFMLSKYEHLHLYPIHPRAAAQFRGALYPSGAKDDPVDADLLLDLLVHHRPHLRRLDPDTEQTRLVRHLVEARRKLVNEKTRQTNRLTAQLKLYFPQVLDWFDSVDSAIVGDLLKRWPTLEALQKARAQTIRSFLAAHNCRGQERIERRLEEIGQAVPAIRDAAVIQSSLAMTKILVEVMAALREGIAALDGQIGKAAAAHPDFAIFHSFPEQVRFWRRASWQHSDRGGTVMARRRRCNSSVESRPSWNVVARVNGFTSAGLVRSFSGKRFRNGPGIPSASVAGPKPTTNSSVKAATAIMPRSARWLSSGFALHSAAGRME